jgi:hypothetical protein
MNTFTIWNRTRGITLHSHRSVYLYLHAIILWCAVKPDTQPLRQIYIIGASGVFYHRRSVKFPNHRVEAGVF